MTLRVPRTPPGEHGFMYVEVLIAMLIFSMVLLAMVPLMVIAARENASSSDWTIVATLARDKAEELKADMLSQINPGSDVVTVADIDYSRSWTIVPDVPHPGLRTITVQVTTNRVSRLVGANRSAQLSFIRAR